MSHAFRPRNHIFHLTPMCGRLAPGGSKRAEGTIRAIVAVTR